jgi:hypothetical protein
VLGLCAAAEAQGKPSPEAPSALSPHPARPSTPPPTHTGGDVKSARAAVLAAPYDGAPPEGHHIHRVFQVGRP